MRPKIGFLSLAEELLFYILSFLSCRDILRCTSVCKALRQTYLSSSELQYIVEMSGQRLLPVSNTDNGIPISARLQLLRDKAHSWFKVDIHSFKTVLMKRASLSWRQIVAGGHVYLWNHRADTARIFPILPKPSQQQFQRNWLPGTLCSVPHSTNLDLIMDPAQNLIAVAYTVDNRRVYIKVGALDNDEVHPQAAGETLFLSDDSENLPETLRVNLKCFGRHIALWRRLDDEDWDSTDEGWRLQIWDWKHSTTSNSILSGAVDCESNTAVDFYFLGNDRLLVITDNLHLYSIEDMSQTPELLACFLMPISLMLRCHLPMGDIEHSEPHMQAQPKMYASDPAHRLICLTTNSSGDDCYYSTQVFIISTRIFFDLDGIAAATPIPWKHWGPPNVRIFDHPHSGTFHISGNRVLQALPVGTGDSKSILHLMDFSPLAVTNSRGLGRVVKEPSTVEVSNYGPGQSLTTSMPYVQVVFSDRNFESTDSELEGVWIDKDRIYMLIADLKPSMLYDEPIFMRRPIGRFEVIDV